MAQLSLAPHPKEKKYMVSTNVIVPRTVQTGKCPRCRGDIYFEVEEDGVIRKCFQCGYEKDFIEPMALVKEKDLH